MSVNEAQKIQKSKINLLKEKLGDLYKKDLDENLKFELEFIKYRLQNILQSKKIVDINPEKTYQFKKLGLYIQKNDCKLVKYISPEEIEEIAALKISDFEKHYENFEKILNDRIVLEYKNNF